MIMIWPMLILCSIGGLSKDPITDREMVPIEDSARNLTITFQGPWDIRDNFKSQLIAELQLSSVLHSAFLVGIPEIKLCSAEIPVLLFSQKPEKTDVFILSQPKNTDQLEICRLDNMLLITISKSEKSSSAIVQAIESTLRSPRKLTENCDENCRSCEEDACILCKDGSYLQDQACIPCSTIPNCLMCSDESTCTKCNTFHVPVAGVCIDCSEFMPYCSECSSTTVCTSCESPYVINGFNRCSTCDEAMVSCGACTDQFTCSECGYGYSLYRKQCTNCSSSQRYCSLCYDGECRECFNGYFLENSGCLNCKTAVNQCIACLNRNECIACSKGYYVLNGGCSKCTVIPQCLECDPEGNCLKCELSYFVRDGVCVKCEESIEGCDQCNEDGSKCNLCFSGFSLTKYAKCFRCDIGYFLKGQDCEECSLYIENCLECSDEETCTECDINYYEDQDHKCTLCSDTIPGCVICDDSETCLDCQDGYFLDSSDKCTACEQDHCTMCDGGTCSECNLEHYLENGTCLPCTNQLDNCLECTSKFNCSACQEGYYMLDGQCYNCSDDLDYCYKCNDNKKCLECNQGYFEKDGICKECKEEVSHCIECSIDGEICNNCQDTYFLKSNKCHSCFTEITNCKKCTEGICYECEETYFVDSPDFCKKCSAEFENCETCDDGKCLKCKKGYYNDGGNCLPCSSVLDNCLECSQDGKECTSCKNEYYLDNKICESCSNMLNCINCSEMDICTKCNSSHLPVNGICTDCSSFIPGCLECESDSICTKCASDHYLSDTYACNTCNSSILNCVECDSSSQCTKCIENYELDSNGQCSNCSFANCSDCIDGECSRCDNGYFLENKECVPCNDTCETCDTRDKCTLCKSGYFINGNSCEPCSSIDKCSECSQNGKCVKCKDSYYAKDGVCQECSLEITGCDLCLQDGSKCTSCVDGYFKNTQEKCSECQSQYGNCETCNDKSCEVCKKGSYLEDGRCQSCKDHCLDCNNSNSCDTCEKGYFPKGSGCEECSNSIGHCLECESESVCSSCDAFSFLDESLSCSKCDSEMKNCIKCSDSDSCSECKDKYFVLDEQCQECSFYVSNCEHCNEDGQICKSCKDGYFLSSNSCVSCSSLLGECELCNDDGSRCNQCAENHILNSDYECKLCSEMIGGCEKCDSKVCTRCDPSFILVNGQCSSCDTIPNCAECDSNECVACVDSYFLEEKQCYQCSKSISNCYQCSNSDTCDRCQTGYYLYDSNCYKCPEECKSCNGIECVDCKDSHFLLNGKCNPCDGMFSNCSKCEDSCTECKEGYYLNDKDECELCNLSNCQVCSALQCLECENGHVLKDGVCQECSDSIEGCLECIDQGDTCTKCIEGKSLVLNSCIDPFDIPNCTDYYSDGSCKQCSDSHYNARTKCEECPNHCQSCTENSCSKCKEGYELEEGKCKVASCEEDVNCISSNNNCECEECNNTHYLDDKSCVLCDNKFENCDYCNSEKCFLCKNNYVLNEEGSCESCEDIYPNCLKCNNNLCNECASGYQLLNSQCLPVVDECKSYNRNGKCSSCNSGYFFNSEQCEHCPKDIERCSEYDSNCQCSVCRQGTYLSMNTCKSCRFFSKISAEFDEEYTHINLFMNTEFKKTDLKCSRLLHRYSLRLLGKNPICRWKSPSQISIELGDSYRMRAGSLIVYSKILRPLSDSCRLFKIRRVRVQIKHPFPEPKVHIRGERQYNINCDSPPLKLFSEIVRGHANSPMHFAWSVSGMSTVFPNKNFITLSPSSSGSYTVSLVATNMFGNKDVSTHNIHVIVTGMVIKIDKGEEVTIKQSEYNEFSAYISEFCGETSEINWEWSSDSTHVLHNSRQPHKLVIYPHDLQKGYTYSFTVTARVGNSLGKAELTVNVISSDLVARIDRPSGSISNGVNLRLSGHQSYDPDDPHGRLSYRWVCYRCFNQRRARLFIHKNRLRLGQEMVVKLQVFKDNRMAETTARFNVKNVGNLYLKYKAMKRRVNCQREIKLELDISGRDLRYFRWRSDVHISKPDLPVLRIPPNQLMPGHKYQFRGTLYSKRGGYIDSFIELEANEGPVCRGGLRIAQVSNSLYEIDLHDCYDQDFLDYPLTFAFGVNGCELTGLSGNNLIRLRFYAGIYYVMGIVCDSLGTCKEYSEVLRVNSRWLNTDGTIQDFEEAVRNPDLTPFYSYMYANNENLSDGDAGTIFGHMKNYTLSLDNPSNHDINAMLNSIYVMVSNTSSKNHEIVDFLEEFLDLNYEKLDEGEIDLTIKIFGKIIDSGHDIKDLERSLALLFNNNNPPDEAAFYESENLSSFSEKTMGYLMHGKVIDIRETTIRFPSLMPFNDTDIVSTEVFVRKDENKVSDEVDLRLYKSGTYDDFVYNETMDKVAYLEELEDPIEIDLSCNSELSPNLRCLYYQRSTEQWNQCALLRSDNQTCTVQTLHSTIIRIGLISKQECSQDSLPIYTYLCVSIVIITFLMIFKFTERKTPNEPIETINKQTVIKSEHYETPDLNHMFKNSSARAQTTVEKNTERHTRTNLCKFHLLIRLFLSNSLPRTKTISLLYMAVAYHMFLSGLLLFVVSDNQDKHSFDIEDVYNFSFVFLISSAGACCITGFCEVLLCKGDNEWLWNAVSWVFFASNVAVCSFGILKLSFDSCEAWNLLWLVVSAISLSIDLIFYQTIVSLVRCQLNN